MTKKGSRAAQPRLWASLVIAGSSVAAATNGVAGHWDAVETGGAEKVWLAQAETGEAGESGEGEVTFVAAEGGEGGEGGAPATASPGTALLIELGKLEAHLLAAARLYDAGSVNDAMVLAAHPEAEFLPELRRKLAERGIADVTPAADALGEAVAEGSEIDAALDAAVGAIRGATDAADVGTRERYDAIVQLVRDAAGEYGHAVDNGEVVDPVALEEARGFLGAASALVDTEADGEVGRKTEKLLTGARVVFPDKPGGTDFQPDASILWGAAARVEIAALRLD